MTTVIWGRHLCQVFYQSHHNLVARGQIYSLSMPIQTSSLLKMFRQVYYLHLIHLEYVSGKT